MKRRSNDGEWHDLSGTGERRGNQFCTPLANPVEARSFIVFWNQNRSCADIHWIDGNDTRSGYLVLDGSTHEYLARWKRLSIGILTAWFLHLTVLFGGIAFLDRRGEIPIYEFGVHRVLIAPLWRRGFALVRDWLLILSVPILMTYTTLPERRIVPQNQICDSLFEIERAIDWCIQNKPIPGFVSVDPILDLIRPLPEHDFTMEITEVLILITTSKLWFEFRFGVTPGKWLFGVRTLRSTLRPVSFARTMVRGILYCVDVPFFVTPLPSLISLMLTPHRQRLGDLVADTVVIRNGSISVNGNCHFKPSE